MLALGMPTAYYSITMSRRASHLRRSRQALAFLCLINMALLTTGLPIPTHNGKDRSVAFICMNSRCGCMTADECWKHCCCHTTEEKLAWAAEHGITPPQYVLDQLAQEVAEPACCCSHAKEKQPTAATKAEKCCDEEVEHKSAPFSWLITIHAIKCQGQDGWSLLASSIVMDPTASSAVNAVCPSIELVASVPFLLNSLPSVPDAPPPRS